jgi:hypothetical protein
MVAACAVAGYSDAMSRRLHRPRPFRPLLALLACLLLLALQQESIRHGMRHLGEQAAMQERSLAMPAVACDECALLAAASSVAVGTVHTAGIPARASTELRAIDATVTLAPPRRYAARAPPLRS